jgi:uncharacterized protein YjbI with pentapeptide repeats
MNSENKRLTYEQSCKVLQEFTLIERGTIPPIPAKAPQYDDEEPLGINFFRTVLENISLNNATLPRTYFSRSEIRKVTFRNSDFSESTVCWNNFIDVDFTEANLANCDLRASIFIKVNWNKANLENTDLRHSDFEQCNFYAAKMKNAKLTKDKANSIGLSKEQRQQIDWQADEGEEPAGG